MLNCSLSLCTVMIPRLINISMGDFLRNQQRRQAAAHNLAGGGAVTGTSAVRCRHPLATPVTNQEEGAPRHSGADDGADADDGAGAGADADAGADAGAGADADAGAGADADAGAGADADAGADAGTDAGTDAGAGATDDGQVPMPQKNDCLGCPITSVVPIILVGILMLQICPVAAPSWWCG